MWILHDIRIIIGPFRNDYNLFSSKSDYIKPASEMCGSRRIYNIIYSYIMTYLVRSWHSVANT